MKIKFLSKPEIRYFSAYFIPLFSLTTLPLIILSGLATMLLGKISYLVVLFLMIATLFLIARKVVAVKNKDIVILSFLIIVAGTISAGVVIQETIIAESGFSLTKSINLFRNELKYPLLSLFFYIIYIQFIIIFNKKPKN